MSIPGAAAQVAEVTGRIKAAERALLDAQREHSERGIADAQRVHEAGRALADGLPLQRGPDGPGAHELP